MNKYPNTPGYGNKSFKIVLSEDWFKKGDLLRSDSSINTIRIIKVYRNTLWRKFLVWLGIKTPLLKCQVEYKVKYD